MEQSVVAPDWEARIGVVLRVLPLIVALGLLISCSKPAPVPQVAPTVSQADGRVGVVEIEVAGVRRKVRVEEHGEPDAPVMLVLHEILADATTMEPFDALANSYYVVRWDRRGEGVSERTGRAEIGFERSLEEIAEMKALYSPDAPVTLLGHGMGALFAAGFAAQHPEQVEQLILIEPPGLMDGVLQESLGTAYDMPYAQSDEEYELDEDQTARLDHRSRQHLIETGLVPRPCHSEVPEIPVQRSGGWVARHQMKELGAKENPAADLASNLETYQKQVLVLGGDCSLLGYDFQMTKNGPAFGRAVILKIADAGHWLWLEQWPRTMGAIESYLSAYR